MRIKDHPNDGELYIMVKQLSDRQMENHQINQEAHETIMNTMKEMDDRLVKRMDIANGRTGKLERWQSYVFGATAVISLLVVPIILWGAFQALEACCKAR